MGFNLGFKGLKWLKTD